MAKNKNNFIARAHNTHVNSGVGIAIILFIAVMVGLTVWFAQYQWEVKQYACGPSDPNCYPSHACGTPGGSGCYDVGQYYNWNGVEYQLQELPNGSLVWVCVANCSGKSNGFNPGEPGSGPGRGNFGSKGQSGGPIIKKH